MKLVTNNNTKKVCCYVQVKDLLYLGMHLKKKVFLDRYYSLKNAGAIDTQFVKVIDNESLSLVLSDETLISFTDYNKLPSFCIATEIIQRMPFIFDETERRSFSQAVHDLRDIILFRRGELCYKIPAIPTDRIEFLSSNLVFSTTIFNGVYSFRTTDGSDASLDANREYLMGCILSIYEMDFPGYTGDEMSYSLIKDDNSLLVRIAPLKKKSRLEQFRAKRKSIKTD